MASTIKRAVSEAQKQAVKNSRVVKRPARGYHRFRGGILNVTPKGREKELVENIQRSPILQLPAELRSRIWECTVVTNILRSEYIVTKSDKLVLRMLSPFSERDNSLALLQTCRQVYAEIALLPCKTAIFATYHYSRLKKEPENLRPFQRAQIRDVQVEIWNPNLGLSGILLENDVSQMSGYNLEFLPALKRVHLLVFKRELDVRRNIQFEELLATARNKYVQLLAGRELDIVVVVSEEKYSDYIARWEKPLDQATEWEN